MNLHQKHPVLSGLRTRARKRIPKFVWEYLDSAAENENTKAHPPVQLDKIGLMPSALHGEFEPDLSVDLLGRAQPERSS